MKTWLPILGLIGALAAVLAAPFALRPPTPAPPADAETLVILSPHNEAVRHEFGRAFREWYRARCGAEIAVDWRSIGGTSEIVRYLDGEYETAARTGREGIGADLFFGGGQYDHARQAKRGHTVPCGVRARHPAWLDEAVLPRTFSGEPFYDPDDRWYGCCLSSFGICYNRDVLAGLGLEAPPQVWADLADPRLFGQVALADPTKSGSINKAFEMLIQEQMAAELAARGIAPEAAGPDDLAAGWARALLLLRRIAANARYFTDSASKVPLDVAQGNAAAGMCIDFYGRFESETVRRHEGSDRLVYVTPRGGSSISVDPISLLKGAPHRAAAERFIDFCLSDEGQRLWNYRVGEPGGPARYALRRLPVRRDSYTPDHLARMADADALPYAGEQTLVYRPAWTQSLFALIRVLIRAMCLDPHAELTAALEAVQRAGGPARCPAALAALGALPPDAEYEAARHTTVKRLNDPLEETRLARAWTLFFMARYRQAASLASPAIPPALSPD